MTEPALASRPEDLTCGPEALSSGMTTTSPQSSSPPPLFSSASSAPPALFSSPPPAASSGTPAFLGFTPASYGDDPDAMVCRAPGPLTAPTPPDAPAPARPPPRSSPTGATGGAPPDRPATSPRPPGPATTAGGGRAEGADTPHSATTGASAQRPGGAGGGTSRRETADEADERRSQGQSRMRLALPARQAARGAARIGREPLFLAVQAPSFSAPRLLDVALPSARSDDKAKQRGGAEAEGNPAAAASAYALAARESESLYGRILAGAAQVAREAGASLIELTDRNERELGMVLARMEDDLAQRRLDAANRRDFVLNHIASRTDLLRAYVVEQANGAIGRMAAMRRKLLDEVSRIRGPTGPALASLEQARDEAYDAANRAHFAIQRMERDPETKLATAPEFQEVGGEHGRGPELVAAMLEAAVHYGPPRFAADDQALADRLGVVGAFVDPLLACTRCDIDAKLLAVETHATNFGEAGPRAVRSARDSSLRSIDRAEQKLTLNVLEAHRGAETALAERHDQTRAMLVAQSSQAALSARRDIEGSGQKQIEALTGVAATQPAALSMVHDEIERAAAVSPARAASLGVRSSERLLRNTRGVSQRHPSGVLASAQRGRTSRLDRAGASARDQAAMARGFDDQQAKFVGDSFDQLSRSIDQSLFGMAGLPGQVGKTCDAMLRTGGEALAKVKETTDHEVTAIVEKLNLACDGLMPPPLMADPALRFSAPRPIIWQPADEPGASLFTPAAPMSPMAPMSSSPLSLDPAGSSFMSMAPGSPLMSPMPTSSPMMSGAPPTTSSPPAPTTSDASAPARTGGPASCGTCESTRAAARGPVTSGATTAAATTGDGSSGVAEGSGSITVSTEDAAGVCTERTAMRSPRAFKAHCDPIASNALAAPTTAEFVTLVHNRLTQKIAQRVEIAHIALDALGETDYGRLFKDCLRGLTPTQGRAFSEEYQRKYHRDLASEIQAHAHDSLITARSTDDYNSAAAIAALEGRAADAALNELRAAFNYSNETSRIFDVMQSLSHDQMAELVSNHRAELESLMTQLSTADQARFRLLMDNNTVRARSTALLGSVDEVNNRHRWGRDSDRRGFALGDAIGAAETAERWALEGPSDRVDVFGLEDPGERAARERRHWADIQQDFGYLDGVAEEIARANPSAAVSRPDDPPGAALLAYATRPLTYQLYGPYQRNGETREQALERQRSEEERYGVTLSEERVDEYGYRSRTATSSLSEYQQHYLEMVVRHGSQSREARAARALAQFRRRDGVPPDHKDLEKSLHSGLADAREMGNFQHGSAEEADRDRLQTFAMMEQFRRQIEGGAIGPISGEDARAAFRSELASAYRDSPDLEVALGVIDSDQGNMQAVIDRAIATENPELLTRYLGRMDSNQIEAMVTEWNSRHPGGPGLYERLGLFRHHWSIGNMNGAAFTGDEANALEIAMMGVPQTDLQYAEVQHRIIQQQIEQAGWLGRLTCSSEYEAMVENARQLRETMGVTQAQFDEFGRVRVIDPDTREPIHFNFDASGHFVPAHLGGETQFQRLLATSRIVADNYTQAVDRMASIITTGIALIAAVVLSVVTMGAGTAVAIALLAGAMTITVNASMRGGRYSRDDLTRDVVATAVQMATAGIGAGMANVGRGAQAAATAGKSAAAFARGLGTTERVLLAATRHPIITQGVLGSLSSGISAALDPAMRRREDYGDQVMHAFFRGAVGGMVTAGVAHGLNSGASAVMQRSASSRALAAALERGASREAAMRLASMSAARMASGRIMEVGFRGLVSGTSAMAGRASELGYENLAGTGHHGAGEFYAEMRHAFIQNAIQGVAEGMASRYLRGRYTSYAEDHARQMQSIRADAAEAAGRAFDREMGRRGVGPEAAGNATGPAPPRAATPDDAVRQATEEAPSPPRPANDNEPEAVPTRRAVGDEEGLPARQRPEEDDLRLRSADGEDVPPSQRETGEFPAVRRTLDEHLKSGDARSAPLFVQEDLTPNRLSGGASIPEHSEFRATDPRNEAASRANYDILRNADPHREVLLARCVDPADPRFGEFVVFQGGASSVSRPPDGWIAERHSHPRLASGEMAERLARSLPSGTGGDFAVLRREVDMMAGLVGSTRDITRTSVIDIRLGETHLETHFSITRNGDSYEYNVTFRPPHDGVESIGPIYSLPDYETAAGNLTGQRFGRGNRETYSTADGTTVSASPPRAVHGEALTATMRQDIEFIAGRMALAGEFEGQLQGGARGEIDPAIGRAASLSDAQERVVRMGLVGERDSMIRLHNIINDDNIPAPLRAMISDLTLTATRNHLIRAGELEAGEPLVLLFHGATPERTQSLVKEGISMARAPGGPNDDFGQGLYFTRSLETALQYRDTRSAGGEGHGGVVPYLLRGREMGASVDVSTGGSLRARWEAFAVANAHTLLQGSDSLAFTPMVERIMRGQVTGFADFDASVHQNRGALFNDFLASIGAHPSVIFGDLGGPLTHGIQLRQVTDQVVIRGQDVADVLNRQHVRAGTSDAETYGPNRFAADESLSMRTASPAEEAATAPARREVDPDIDRRVEQSFGPGVEGEIETAPRPPVSPEGWELVNDTIGGFRNRTDEFGVALNRLMDMAPHETGRILRRIAFDSNEGRQLVLTDAHVGAIVAEAVRGGASLAQARALAMDLLTVATPQSPLHGMLSEAPFGAGFEQGLQGHLDAAFEERMAVRVARQFGDADSPNPARQGMRRLLDIDPGAVIRAILSPTSIPDRLRAFYRARRAAGARAREAIADARALRDALGDGAFGDTQQTWRERLQAAGMTAADLANLVRERPDELLHMARTNPAQLTEFFADFVLRQLPGDNFAGPPTAEQFSRYVRARQRSNILPVASESSSIWANLKRMGLHLLKADAVSRGGANRPGLDIVGFSVPPGARVREGDQVRVVIMDDKAYRSTELESVSAMTGDRLPTNLRASADEIEADIRALRNLGADIVDERIANHIAGAEAAVRQMRQAADQLDAARPKTDRGMRGPRYLRKVADILQRNNIVPAISSEFGNVRVLADWLRLQGFRFDDEYVAELEREFRRRGVIR